jgi:hypothetical protein
LVEYRCGVDDVLTRHSGLDASVATEPETADAPWLAVRNGFASFVVPADFIQKTLGEVSVVVVEGDFGPSFHRAQLALTLSSKAWRAIIGPLAPGSYHYRVVGMKPRRSKIPPTQPA